MDDARKVQYIQVPVPEDLVEEVYAFLTERRRQTAPTELSQEPQDDAEIEQSDADAADEPWDEPSLREFLHRANPKLRKLLIYLAERAPEHVGADEAFVAAGLTPGRSAGGFLSRARRSSYYHFGRALPLGRDWNPERGRNDYYVTADVARVVLDDRKESGR